MKTLFCEEFDAFESIVDTDYFGIPSAKVVLKKACWPKQKQDDLLYFIHDFEFLVISNIANNPTNNRWLGEKTKAFLVDINIQFRKEKITIESVVDRQIEICDNLADNNQMVEIAENSFTFSRFLNDPYLSKEKARGIYGDIVKKAFGKPGRYFAFSKINEEITGFILFSMHLQTNSSTIELIAVNENFRRKGIGQILIKSMESYVYTQEIKTIFVGTQLNNGSALSFYYSNGFRYHDCSSIYHYWPLKQ